jgi:pimeloyl-ACP methyl ester carboxylesterase
MEASSVIDQERAVDFAACGTGPTLLLVPGSLSTGAAWKSVVDRLAGHFRIVTTSLLGNGGTAERRVPGRATVDSQADALEEVVARAGGGPVHVAAHSYGGVGVLALALRRSVPIASLVLIEANPADLLRQAGELDLYRKFRAMSDPYVAAYTAGEPEAVRRLVDFYGGAGSYAALPARARDYLVARTPSNILDWEAMYRFAVPLADFAGIAAPTVVVRGMRGHPAMIRVGALVAEAITGAELASVEDANHFMLGTHAALLADLIAGHVARCHAVSNPGGCRRGPPTTSTRREP